MPNKMLIDATHPEETRVVVLRGHRVEEFDFESASRKQLRGNIYLAKVTRVEPSLQAAFVDYGGNRHGFLAFSEIHPDYYQIPVADRQALIAEDERAQRAAEAEADHRAGRRHARRERASDRVRDEVKSEPVESALAESTQTEGAQSESDVEAMTAASEQMAPPAGSVGEPMPDAGLPVEIATESNPAEPPADAPPTTIGAEAPIELAALETSSASEPVPTVGEEFNSDETHGAETADTSALEKNDGDSHDIEVGHNITEVNGHGAEGEEEIVESVGGADAMEEVPERMPRLRRQYKIQEVIKRRQVMLVQVVKEERGTKGAALTTYLSLAGRYSVLMPNTARGGGISRKITSADDRRRLKEIAQELEVPEGMGVILRTAGAARTKTEVKRDFEYLLRMWETVRDLTLKSTAPMLVYEEGSLVKRSIRDLYNKDIEEILVAGDDAYKEAKDFMRMLMPSHAMNVKSYRDNLPIFTRHGIESQLDAMFTPVMQLRSGGYIVLNQAEALVAIDVNSGRATREHHIEDTALKTNLEAAEEVARQLRLRDLAGLIVIDFIDMDEKRNNRTVERRLKDALRNDRARIQVGRISHFGLMEMSRQRIRTSVLESSTEKCPHCGGTGHVRSVSSVALQLLRSLDEMLLKGATHNLTVRTRSEIALYLLNHKRAHLRVLEERFRIVIMVNADATVEGQVSFVIEKGEQVHSLEQAKALALQPATAVPAPVDDEEDEDDFEADDVTESEESVAAAPEADGESEGETDQDQAQDQGPDGGQGRKRRRRRRGRRGGEGREVAHAERDNGAFAPEHDADFAPQPGENDLSHAGEGHEAGNGAGGPETPGESGGEAERRRRRRGRRGGRRNRRGREGEGAAAEGGNGEQPEFEQAARDADDGIAAEPEAPAMHVPVAEPHHDLGPQSDLHSQSASAPETPPEPTHMPAAQIAASAGPETAATERSRRRSTVREPAAQVLREQVLREDGPASEPPPAPPTPTAEPVVSSTAEESESPRRSGWWSKRVLGRS